MRRAIQSSLKLYGNLGDSRPVIWCYGEGKRLGSENDISTGRDNINQVLADYKPQEIRAIIGHFKYKNLEDFLGPQNSYQSTFSITRNPIDRTISHINHIRFEPKSPNHKKFLSINSADLFDALIAIAKSGWNAYMASYLASSLESDIQDYEYFSQSVLARVCLFKVESMETAIRTRVGPKSCHTGEVANSAKSLQEASLSEAPVLNANILSKSQRQILKDHFLPDYLLYEASL